MSSDALPASPLIESRFAWLRLLTSLAIMTINGAGMYSVVVVLPAVQAEFGVARGEASLPYTLTLIGFGLGGMLMGRLADRLGVVVPLTIGCVMLGAGLVGASFAGSLLSFALIQGLVIGLLGTSSSFAPLIADTSMWFTRRRGIAVAICASGNYLAGAIWPPIVQTMVEAWGWRTAYLVLGIVCTLGTAPLVMLYRKRAPAPEPAPAAMTDTPAASTAPPGPAANGSTGGPSARPFGMSPNQALALLSLAGVGCCVAMSMPQVHIVAYCSDLGYGAASGAQMLSLMLAFGIVSRLASGFISDRIGGVRTLLLGAIMQAVALALYLPFDSLHSLYAIAILFGLFQGGIVPSYTIIVREYFPAQGAATRVSIVLTATLLGMAWGGWLSGRIFDLTGSYDAAFINGLAWNFMNLMIGVFLLRRLARIKAGQA